MRLGWGCVFVGLTAQASFLEIVFHSLASQSLVAMTVRLRLVNFLRFWSSPTDFHSSGFTFRNLTYLMQLRKRPGIIDVPDYCLLLVQK